MRQLSPDRRPIDDPTTKRRWTVALDGGAADPAELGGKGASLDRLIGWGLPVPPTGVMTAAVSRAVVACPSVSELTTRIRKGDVVPAAEVDAAFLAARLPDGVSDDLWSLAQTIADGHRIALRSSATVEDLAQSSFAGQYRSELGVDPHDHDAVERAFRCVLASLWYPAPCAYRRAVGLDDQDVAMAVVVMRMVEARRSGVVFTVDPGGDDQLARVEHVAGVATELVGGRVNPDVLRVPRAGTSSPPDTHPAAVRALELALEVEARAGCPQDVEWAWDGDVVWLVQARPITTLVGEQGDGFDDRGDVLDRLDLTTAGIGEMLPGVLPPLAWDLGSHLVEEAFRAMLDRLAVLPDDLVDRRGFVRRVRGRAAMDFSRLQAMAHALPGATVEDLEEQYFGSGRRGRPSVSVNRRRAGWLRSAVHDVRVAGIRRRAVVDADIVTRAAIQIGERTTRTSMVSLSDSELAARHLRLVDLATRAMAAELAVAADAAASYRRLELTLGRHLGRDDVGRFAAELSSADDIAVNMSVNASAAVFAGPTWAELGRTPPTLLRAPAADESDPMATLRATLAAGRLREDGWRSRLWLRSVRTQTADVVDQLRRRERVKAAILDLGGEVRRLHLEAGRRLAEAGRLATADDIDLLAAGELRHALISGELPPASVLERRRRWRRRCEHDGPLPARFSGVPQAIPVAVGTGRRLEGWAASPGRYVGRARVVDDPGDGFGSDEVLVAKATDPSWSPLFVRAGAIVLERGGPLSHAAILARELGVPAVLNVSAATALLDGHDIAVDGDAGTVVIVDERTEASAIGGASDG